MVYPERHTTSGGIDTTMGGVEEGPHDLSRGPHTIKYEVSQKIEETILDLRLEEIWL